MQIDRYTKAVLTVIALALIGINIALLDRVVKPAHAAETVIVSRLPVMPINVEITRLPVLAINVKVTNWPSGLR